MTPFTPCVFRIGRIKFYFDRDDSVKSVLCGLGFGMDGLCMSMGSVPPPSAQLVQQVHETRGTVQSILRAEDKKERVEEGERKNRVGIQSRGWVGDRVEKIVHILHN